MKKYTLLLIAIAGFLCFEAKAIQPINPISIEKDLRIGEQDPDKEIKEALNSYRKERRIGHLVGISGITLVIVGETMVYAASTFPAAYPLIVVGGGMMLTGYLIDWHAGKHLKFEDLE